MCTAIRFIGNDRYFGRNLDLDRSYGEEICVMPRRFPIVFRQMGEMREHYAMIGMATVMNEIPLFYEAANEYGLAMAGLNFPGNADYPPFAEGKDNIAPFEFIPWILGQCKTLGDARALLARINLVDLPFSTALPLSPLHWMISDGNANLVVESMRDGLHIYDNPVGVLTNNPPFPYHLENLKKYDHLRIDNSKVKKQQDLPYVEYCQGLGAVGLPGDLSSMSRFVRAAFGVRNALPGECEEASVGQFFHLLQSVAMVKGLCRTDEGTWDITGYSACINLDRGLYYYTTYHNRSIRCVNMHAADLDGRTVSRFALDDCESIKYRN